MGWLLILILSPVCSSVPRYFQLFGSVIPELDDQDLREAGVSIRLDRKLILARIRDISQ